MHGVLRDTITNTRRLIAAGDDNLTSQFENLKRTWSRRSVPDREDSTTFIFPLFLLTHITPLPALETLLRPRLLQTHNSGTVDQIYRVVALAKAWGLSEAPLAVYLLFGVQLCRSQPALLRRLRTLAATSGDDVQIADVYKHTLEHWRIKRGKPETFRLVNPDHTQTRITKEDVDAAIQHCNVSSFSRHLYLLAPVANHCGEESLVRVPPTSPSRSEGSPLSELGMSTPSAPPPRQSTRERTTELPRGNTGENPDRQISPLEAEPSSHLNDKDDEDEDEDEAEDEAEDEDIGGHDPDANPSPAPSPKRTSPIPENDESDESVNNFGGGGGDDHGSNIDDISLAFNLGQDDDETTLINMQPAMDNENTDQSGQSGQLDQSASSPNEGPAPRDGNEKGKEGGLGVDHMLLRLDQCMRHNDDVSAALEKEIQQVHNTIENMGLVAAAQAAQDVASLAPPGSPDLSASSSSAPGPMPIIRTAASTPFETLAALAGQAKKSWDTRNELVGQLVEHEAYSETLGEKRKLALDAIAELDRFMKQNEEEVVKRAKRVRIELKSRNRAG